MREDAPIFTSDFFGETASQNTVRQPLKTSPELVTFQLGEPNSETPTPASPPPRNRVIYAALGLPPRGTASISLIPPKALVVVDVAEAASPPHWPPGERARAALIPHRRTSASTSCCRYQYGWICFETIASPSEFTGKAASPHFCKEAGWAVGRNVTIDVRWAAGDVEFDETICEGISSRFNLTSSLRAPRPLPRRCCKRLEPFLSFSYWLPILSVVDSSRVCRDQAAT